MSRKVETVSLFNGGMILNADPCDLPQGFGVVALDTMPTLDGGSIGGRYAEGSGTGYDNVEHYAYITGGAGYNLVYINGTGSRIYADGVELANPTNIAKCVTGHRNYSLIGRTASHAAYYYGYPRGGGVAVSCDNDFSALCQMDKTLVVPTEEPYGSFEADVTYYYAASIVYDGYMHGPLSSPCMMKMHVANAKINVLVTLPDDAVFGARATSVNLYKAVSSPGMNDVLQISEYFKIAEFTDFSLGTIEFLDANEVSVGSSFANTSGLDETVSFCNLGYEIAYEMNNFLFVGNVGWMKDGVQQIPDGSRMLYRSIRGKHSQFRIIDDYLNLPFIPVAITSFNSRLIVFGSAEFALVNPESMVVEEVVHGYGLESDLCVLATIAGVFFANKHNLYAYDGREITPIGTPILSCHDARTRSTLEAMNLFPYESVARSSGIQKVAYSSRTNSVLFLYEAGGVYAYVFSLDTKTWSVSSFGSANPKSAYIDRDNQLFIGTLQAFAGSSRVKNWKYVTKRFTLGEASKEKKIYFVHVDATTENQTVYASFDGGEFTKLEEPHVPIVNRMARTIMIQFSANESDSTYVNRIEIVYREMANTK